jgi:hypothetical protein
MRVFRLISPAYLEERNPAYDAIGSINRFFEEKNQFSVISNPKWAP